jgi:hypothetical protein
MKRCYFGALAVLFGCCLGAAAHAGQVTGRIVYLNGSMIVIDTRDGRLNVDATAAQRNDLSVVLYMREPVIVSGSFANGILHASSVGRAKPQPELWLSDTLSR